MFAGIAFPGFFFTFLAFLLLLLTTISTPVVKDLYFLQVTSNSSATASTLRLGTLGYCLSGTASSALSSVTNGTSTTGCTSARLGYDLNYSLFSNGDIWGISIGNLSNTVIKGLTYLLVFQPIAAALALISLSFAFFAWCCASRLMEILATLSSTLTSLIAWIGWATAMALFAIAKNRIQDASDGALSVKLGNCLWMGLGAAISLSIAICCTCAGSLGSYRKKEKPSKSENRTAQPYPYAYQHTPPHVDNGYPVATPSTQQTNWKRGTA